MDDTYASQTTQKFPLIWPQLDDLTYPNCTGLTDPRAKNIVDVINASENLEVVCYAAIIISVSDQIGYS